MKKATKYVKNDLFQQQSDFFSPLDRGQVKYEMLRAHSLEGHFITKVCKEFGYSRESFYLALEAFRREGIAGLVDKPKGKNKPDKVTPEIIGYVIYQRATLGLSGAAIAKDIFREFNLKLHKRTVERILGYYGILDR
ncbi:MAG: helix-turn-helix domain containing protein [Desulfobacteraceae bacterium]|jgi:transposase|nr:helix-turn-helix domain containing protein [Desulfobacteraceae bacterium]